MEKFHGGLRNKEGGFIRLIILVIILILLMNYYDISFADMNNWLQSFSHKLFPQ